jgi:site-specific recombinase
VSTAPEELVPTVPAPTSVGLDEFIKTYAPNWRGNRSVKQLHKLLVAIEPRDSLEERLSALEKLAKWTRDRAQVPAPKDAPKEPIPQLPRLRLLVRVLREVPAFRSDVARVVTSVLAQTTGLHLFSRMGLPSDRGLFGETVDRVSRRLLPAPVDENDLGQLVARMFPGKREPMWLRAIDASMAAELLEVLSAADPDTFAPVRGSMADALALLATRVSALGLSDDIRARSPNVTLQERPFFRLPRTCDELVATPREAAHELRQERASACKKDIDDCRAIVVAVLQALETRGVSVDVVYRVELITKSLDRMEQLIGQLARDPEAAADDSAPKLLARLVEDKLRDRNLVEIARTNLRLLARKIIERAGTTGEHYITVTRAEYRMMLVSAGGGGVLTTGTAALKFLIAAAKFAPFVEGALAAMNYAGSFIMMQLLGMTLATKQPSMTAAALAGALRQSDEHHDISELTTTIARITRSQFAAALGNLGMVIPACFGFDFAYQHVYGKHFLDEKTAEYVLHSLHPFESGTIFYAALTGVLLWASSVGAGWIENWAVYRRLPEAIAEHRIRRVIGRGVPRFFSRFFAKNISGFGGNTTLGVLLGMTPVMGKFFGLPLDVRHVTLSTGALTLGVCALGSHELREPGFLFAALGIGIIGILNFGVSFVLALTVALRAREVHTNIFRIFGAVMKHFLRAPFSFFFPPAADNAPRAPHH